MTRPARPLAVTVCLAIVALALAGCLSDNEPNPADAEATNTDDSTRLDVHCGGTGGAVPAIEFGVLGSCWGHTGHHTYYLGGTRNLTRANVTLFAVEIEDTTSAEGAVVWLTASIDGQNWQQLAAIDYPLGDNNGRHELHYNWTGNASAAFLRVHMPRSAHDGLAGYLDASLGNLTVGPVQSAPVGASDGATCADGLLESFFAEHPCWFGGTDGIQDGEPGPQLTVTSFEHESWFDSPSFIHTYLVAGGGPIQVTARGELWRAGHWAYPCGALDPGPAIAAVPIHADASGDGWNWTRIGTGTAPAGEPATFTADLPDDARFLRLAADYGQAYDVAPCHHPMVFLVDSAWMR